MQGAPFHWLLSLSIELFLSSCIGGVSYALCRFIEPRWNPPDFIGDIAIFILFLVFCHFVSVMWWGPSSFVWLMGYAALVAVGARFHRRSGGSSKHGFGAYMLMVTACLCSFELGTAPYHFTALHPLLPVTAGLPYALGIFFYPLLAPLALWIWQTIREGWAMKG